MRSASVGFQCPDCVKAGSATIRTPKAAYGGKARVNPEITYGLIGINAIVFVLTTLSGTGVATGSHLSRPFINLALIPVLVANGDYYRLLTSTFLHFGIVHIGLNMYCLYLLGPTLERSLGRLRFAALYLVSGLSGAALSYAFGPVIEIAAGASGAVFGLFAAYFVLERKRGGDLSAISATIGINLAFSFLAASYIDWRGHVGGLIGGGLVAVALVHAPAGARRWVYQVGGVAVVALAVGLLVAWRTAVLT